MRKRLQKFKWLLLLLPSIGAPQLFLNAQGGRQVKAGPGGDSSLTSVADTMKGRIVRLPYSTVPTNATSASYDVVYRKDLVKAPVSNVINALTGRLSGVFTEQFSGQPGSDGANISLHGRTPIVLIDGVVRNLTTLDLEEIESVTVLKDAVATATLGVRGANGAILITTRKGNANERNISFTAQSGIQQPLGLPKVLNAYDYATLYNEAQANDGVTALKYSPTDLSAYQTGLFPLNHPNVDFQSLLLRKTSMINRYSFNASGGNNFSRYFVALEHLNQQGLLKESPSNVYATNNFLKSYLARTNIDLNITSKLTAGIALLGRIINGNEPGGTTATIFNGILNTPNNAYPIYNQDGTFAGSRDYTMAPLVSANSVTSQSTNLQGLSTASGYRQNYRRDILADFYLKRTLDEITPGLWVKARVSYSSTLTENITRTKVFPAFQANGSSYTAVGGQVDQINTNTIGGQGRSSYTEGSLGYSRTFNTVHGIDILALVNRDQIASGSDIPYIVSGGSSRISYNFKQRYGLDFSFAYNGSNRYNNGNGRKGFFPAVGAYWNLSNESFMQHMTWMSNLKLFGSYGKMGWDNPPYYGYIQSYGNGSQVYFGTSAGAVNTLQQNTLAYADITWEKANKANIGLQGNLINSKLGFSVEYYNNKFYDLLTQRGTSTGLLGINYPNENIGQNRYTGFDFSLNWKQSIGKFSYYIAANASIQHSKVLYFAEANLPNAYNLRTGQMVGRPFGYIADGLFQSAAEAASSPTLAGYVAKAGDIKYRDLNNDGVINTLDQTAIGTDKPLTPFGVDLGFKWKGFDMSALVQGVVNRNRYITQFAFQNNGLGQAYESNLDRWTPTNPNAAYPRLTIGTNTNNQAFSSFYEKKGDYVRLKSLEIGFTLPTRLAGKAKLSSARVFANGYNLLTKTSLKDIDPEVYGSYPIQRVFNFGINIKL